MDLESISGLETEIDWHKEDIIINERKIAESKRKIDQYRLKIEDIKRQKNQTR